jgi:CheY-like chemotaxis protein
MMPELDGFEMLQQLRLNPAGREIPVIVVTAKDLTRQEREWLELRAALCLQKSQLDAPAFIDQMRALIRAQQAHAPQRGARSEE